MTQFSFLVAAGNRYANASLAVGNEFHHTRAEGLGLKKPNGATASEYKLAIKAQLKEKKNRWRMAHQSSHHALGHRQPQLQAMRSSDLMGWLSKSENPRPSILAAQESSVHYANPGEEDKAHISLLVQQARKKKWFVTSLVSVAMDCRVMEFEHVPAPMEVVGLPRPREHVPSGIPTQIFSFLTVNKEGTRILYLVESEQVANDIQKGKEVGKKAMATAARRSVQIPFVSQRFDMTLDHIRVTWSHSGKVLVALHFTDFLVNGIWRPRSIPDWVAASSLATSYSQGAGIIVAQGENPADANVSRFPEDTTWSGTRQHTDTKGWRRRRSTSLGAAGAGHPATDVTETIPMIALMRHATSDLSRVMALKEQQEHRSQELWWALVYDGILSIQCALGSIHCDHFVAGDVPVLLKSAARAGSSQVLRQADEKEVRHENIFPPPARGKYKEWWWWPTKARRISQPVPAGDLVSRRIEVDYLLSQPIEEILADLGRRKHSAAVWMELKKNLLDPTHASVYDLVSIDVAPCLVNLEMEVLEQLVDMLERETLIIRASGGQASTQPALEIQELSQAFAEAQVPGDEDDLGGLASHRPTGSQSMLPWNPPDPDSAGRVPQVNDARERFVHPAKGANMHQRITERAVALDRTLRKVAKPPLLHTVKELRNLTEANFRSLKKSVYFADQYAYALPLILSSPRWNELKDTHSVYFQKLRISSLDMTFSIRTSGRKIKRNILYIVDALPLDSPYVSVQVPNQKRDNFVSTWRELFASLQHSYISSLIQRSLPLGWLYYPLAPVMGIVRGGKVTRNLITESSQDRKILRISWIIAFTTGMRLGVVVITLYFFGGAFFLISHLCDFIHKLLGGSRKRPSGILEGYKLGFQGFFRDTLWNPWAKMVVDITHRAKRGENPWKILGWTVVHALRCCLCAFMGTTHFVASIAEAYSNALIGDFEHLSRLEESADLIKGGGTGSAAGAGTAASRTGATTTAGGTTTVASGASTISPDRRVIGPATDPTAQDPIMGNFRL